MKSSTNTLLALLFLLPMSARSQHFSSEKYGQYGQLIRLHLETSAFPDTARLDGHQYDGNTYPYLGHYDDNTVLVFVPDYFRPARHTDVVVHFHGWYNNVDSVLQAFQLVEQFHAAGRNAVLVVPQGPKNAPDSYGGKLERAGAFRAFMAELLNELHRADILRSAKPGCIVLSGHSGAYRAMAHILLHGGLPVREVLLFDGLYGQLEKYGHWLAHGKGRFINLYTSDGGTYDQSLAFMTDLDAWGIPYLAAQEPLLTDEALRNNRIIMAFTPMEHNEVLHLRQGFQRFLATSRCLKPAH